ncbi:hypothetical protein [Absidia glauca]|uniref:Late embryogenesis abundant protein LEA-2 subgroup domain-containing protein n=1 Tax=Absidia glauca TaxID=4829 RepID=A0A163JPH9_ABSGL|nr:hypothetical protein [Absidia glauca]
MTYYPHYDGLYCGPSTYYTPPPPKQVHHSPVIAPVQQQQEQQTPSDVRPSSPFYAPNHISSNHQPDPETKPVRDTYNDKTNVNTKAPLQSGYEENDRRRQQSCCDAICCGCCVCCPRWIRYCSCLILLVILAILGMIAGLASTFSKPTLDFGGLQGTPEFSLTGTTGFMQFNMNIIVTNPNIASVTFSSIEAKAFYPNVGGMDLSKMPIGGGNKTNVRIGAKSKTTVTFPFTIHFDAFSSTTAPIIGDLLQKCGINNQAKQDIVINYDVTPIINLAGFPITFTISSHAAFACPEGATDGINNVLAPLTSMMTSGSGGFPTDLSGVKSMLGSSLPTDLLNSLPSGLLNGL